jgi:2-haloacid dehalogenase
MARRCSLIEKIKTKFVISPLSNLNYSLLDRIAKHSSLPWNCMISGEYSRHYKLDPEIYRSATHILKLPAESILLVAAHMADLKAAAAEGLRTAYIPRPSENYEAEESDDFSPDVRISDLGQLATILRVDRENQKHAL